MLTALAVGLGSLLAVTAPAQAATATYPTYEPGTWNGMSTHWGNIEIGGRYGFCVDPGIPAPDNLDDADATKICGTTDASGTPDIVAQMAYLIARYDHTTDTQIAASVSQFSRTQYHDNIPVSHPDVYSNLVAEAKRNGGPHDALVQVDADNLTVWYGLVRPGETDRTTAHFADGFTATLTITTPNATFAGGSQTVTVTTGTAAKSVALVPRHALIADEQVTVTISIGDVPQSCYLLHDSGNDQQRVATGLTTSVTGSGTGKATETKWTPQVTTQIGSTVVAPGAKSVSDKVKADAINGTQWPVSVWADAIQTQPKTYFPLVASGQIAKSTMPPAPSASLPAGATVLPGDPTLVTLSGPGVYSTSDVPLPADPGSGHYSIRWCLDPAYQGANAKYLPKGGPTCDQWFATDERFTMPMRINVASSLPDQYRAKGQAPDDTITLTLPDSADQWISTTDGKPAVVTVDGTYYAGSASSFVVSDTVPADAKALGTASVNVTLPTSGRDPVTVAAPAGFTVPTSQYGVWVWRVDVDHQSDAVKPLIAASVADKFGQQLETHVTQMDLTVQSQVTDETITEPTGKATAQVCDAVWVEPTSPTDLWLNQWGTDKPVEVSVDGAVYHSAVPGAQTIPTGDVPAVDQYTLTFTASGKDHAQTVCHQVGYGDYGAYGFQYTIDPVQQPAATKDYLTNKVTTPLWLPVETTMVKRTPVIRTAATTWDTTNNGVTETFFQDDIWQIDWPDNPTDTDMYGAIGHANWAGYGPWDGDGKTVTVNLWRIQGSVTPDSCTADNPNATLVASNSATPAINTWAASQKVSGSKFKASGSDATYTFVVSWPGDARTEPYRSVCGEKSETISIVTAKPDFITQLVAPADADTSTVDTAQTQETGITVQPGGDLVDVLHAWYPGDTARPAPMTELEASWQAYFTPATADSHPAEIVTDASGAKVYSNAVCTPDTLYWQSGQPVAVEQPGTFASPSFTAPDQPGSLFLVETITDTSGSQPTVIHRGLCGTIAESAIVPAPPAPPAPKIATQAPSDANVGAKITDKALLTGPYAKGTVIQWWVQHTDYVDPSMPQDKLQCVKADPEDMTGAVKVGEIILDHDILDGATETIYSPEFTSDQTGCTNIKEIVLTPATGGDQEVIAHGWFGQTNEVTRWHQPGPAAETGGTVLASTGAGNVIGLAAVGLALIGAGVATMWAVKRRRSSTEE
ncbi:MAG: hypothetical protein FWF36_00360 [Propionibacteriaceae bacterium]|nr:hypothetical protein [Propionibacteriaceae bacterium]